MSVSDNYFRTVYTKHVTDLFLTGGSGNWLGNRTQKQSMIKRQDKTAPGSTETRLFRAKRGKTVAVHVPQGDLCESALQPPSLTDKFDAEMVYDCTGWRKFSL